MVIRYLKRKIGKKENNSKFELLTGVSLLVDPEASTNIGHVNVQDFKFDPHQTFKTEGLTICEELTKKCQDLQYLPETKTFILSDESFCKLANSPEQFIDDIAIALNVNKGTAMNAVSEFFSDRTLLVQQTGTDGFIYKVGSYTQTGGSAILIGRTVAMARAAGVEGLALVQAQPFLVFAIPTVGAIFFHGCGAIAGNNTIGRSCNSIGNFLNLPMSLIELTYNTYLSRPIAKITGISTVLNYTKQMQRGPGLDPIEAMKLVRKSKTLPKVIRCWIIEHLGGKCP